MNYAQLKQWTLDVLGATDRGGRRLRSLARILDSSVETRLAPYAAFEIAVSSSSAASRLQLSHLHFAQAPVPRALAIKADARKAAAARRAVESIVRASRGARWRTILVRQVLDLFQRWGTVGVTPLFSCEYDRARQEVSKITLYTRPDSRAHWRELNALVGCATAANRSWPGADALDCVGVDFWPDGDARLKVYALYPLDCALIQDTRIREFFRKISRRHAVKDLLVLNRLKGARKDVEWASKTVLRLSAGMSLQDVHDLLGQKAWVKFEGELDRLLPGQTVYYVGCSRGSIELCFRRNDPPWPR